MFWAFIIFYCLMVEAPVELLTCFFIFAIILALGDVYLWFMNKKIANLKLQNERTSKILNDMSSHEVTLLKQHNEKSQKLLEALKNGQN